MRGFNSPFGGARNGQGRQAFGGSQGGRRGQAGRRGGRGAAGGPGKGHWFEGRWYPASAGKSRRDAGGSNGRGNGYRGRSEFSGEDFGGGMSGYAKRVGHRF